MQFSDSVTIAAPREKVWEFLTDPHAVASCAPGLESVDVLVPDEKFEVKGSVGLGTVQVHFVATVEWLNLEPPEHAELKAHGTAPGSAMDASASMSLQAISPDETKMEWTADVTIAGTIASLASRMMGSVTKKLAQAFFTCLKREVEA
ncbi:MAG: carbon monoxide dehydrogenase subunit G [Anaerolineales bacterium]|jgi:carbon monoxide dehydrogenase subunit G